MGSTVIEISNLTKKYGDYTAVDHLNLTINKGEIFGLLGPNGAGKSTTMLMLMGLSESHSGKVSVCDINPATQPIEIKRKVGYLPEDVGFYDDMSGLENLVYTARLNGIPESKARDKAIELLNKVGLSEEIDKKAGKYSRGMRQRLGLADVLIKDPEVIILDEPTLGIDPTGVKAFLDLIVSLSRKDGITVLFSSHLLHQVQKVCDRVGIFVKGKLLAEGNVDSLAQQLFDTSAFNIEAGLNLTDPKKNGRAQPLTTHELAEKIKQLDAVEKVTIKNDLVHIECAKDIAPDIARTIVGSGIGLNHLHKKAYGLDDIYYQYFEGGDTNE